MKLDIYTQTGELRFSIEGSHEQSVRHRSLMNENYVQIVFTLDREIVFEAGDHLEYEGEVYTLAERYYPTRPDDLRYDYQLRFQGEEYIFKQIPLFNYVSGGSTEEKEPEFSFTGNLEHFITDVILPAIHKFTGDTTWEKGELDSGATESLTFAGTFVWDALTDIANVFKSEWWLSGKKINFSKCEFGPVQTFSLGPDGGLSGMDLQETLSRIPNRIYAYGSARNITKRYNAEGTAYNKRLHLPSGVEYVELPGVTKVIPAVVFFDKEEAGNVYPRRTGIVSQVETGGTHNMPVYYFYDKDLDFNPQEQLIEGTSMMVHFESGSLMGRDFELAYDESKKRFEIINGQENDRQIPFGNIIPRAGDKYVLWNLEMPQSYITDAEKELQQVAQAYVEKINKQTPAVHCTSDPVYFHIYGKTVTVGSKVKILSSRFPQGYVQSRVTEFTYPLYNKSQITFTVADSVAGGRLAEIENKIKDVTGEAEFNKQFMQAVSRRSWRDAQELQSMLDSLAAEMILVGNPESQFASTCIFKSNKNNDPDLVAVSAGELQHKVYKGSADGKWNIEQAEFTLTDNTPYYLYFQCSKTSNAGRVIISATRLALEGEPGYYQFLAGVVSSVFENARILHIVSGFTQIAGGNITTEKIQDPTGNLIIDLTSVPPKITTRNGAYFIGEFRFIDTDGKDHDISDKFSEIDNSVESIQNYFEAVLPGELENLQNQIDGQIESFFEKYDPALTNYPAKDWTTDAVKDRHLNDTFTNLNTGASWTFVKEGSEYKWVEIQDTATKKALALAGQALDTADGKRRVFISQPYPPYDEGDLWMQGPSGDAMRCIVSRLSGSFVKEDWDPATKYTDDTVALQAKQAADKAQTDANAAQQTANEAISTLDTWASDNFVSPNEKTALIQQKSDIISEYTDIANQVNRYALVTSNEYTAYKTAYEKAVQTINKYTASSPESIPVESDYNNIAAYYTARQNVLNQIAIAAKKVADDAQKAADAALEKTDILIRDVISDGKSLEDLRELAKDGKTIIKGGLINAELIESVRFVAIDKNKAIHIDSTTGKISLQEKKESVWAITAEIEGTEYPSLNVDGLLGTGSVQDLPVISEFNSDAATVTIINVSITATTEAPTVIKIPEFKILYGIDYNANSKETAAATIGIKILLNGVIKAQEEFTFDNSKIEEQFEVNPNNPNEIISAGYYGVDSREILPVFGDVSYTADGTLNIQAQVTFNSNNSSYQKITTQMRFIGRSFNSYPLISQPIVVNGYSNVSKFFGNGVLFSQATNKYAALLSTPTDAVLETRFENGGYRMSAVNGTQEWDPVKNMWVPLGTSGTGFKFSWSNVSNKPLINGRSLAEGNNTLEALGIQPAGNYLVPSDLDGYATEDWANKKFFPFSGGTITGNVAVQGKLSPKTFIVPQTVPAGLAAGEIGLYFGEGEWAENVQPGGGGVSSWINLEDKPQINGRNLLPGNNTLAMLGIQPAGNYLTGITSLMVTTALGFTPVAPGALAGYLPLTAGASYPLTGPLYTKNSINAGNSKLTYLLTLMEKENGVGLIYNQTSDGTTIRSLQFGTSIDANSLFYDASTGRWGIGTITPTAKLTVNGAAHLATGTLSANPAAGQFSNTNTFSIVGDISNRYGLHAWVRSSGNAYLQVGRGDGNTSVYNLILQALGGNVGIGVESPAFRLDVAGDMRAHGGYFYSVNNGNTLRLGSATTDAIHIYKTNGTATKFEMNLPLNIKGDIWASGYLYAAANDNTVQIGPSWDYISFAKTTGPATYFDFNMTLYAQGNIVANAGFLYSYSNGITTQIGAQNSSYTHYMTTANAHWFNKKVEVAGEIYAGSSYDKLVLHEGNYYNYAPTRYRFSTNRDTTGGYYKIKINSATSWMLSFVLRVYQSYQATDIQISGYNYGTNYWYEPRASLIAATRTDSIEVKFGYDSAWNLWVAIPALQYTGIEISSVVQGFGYGNVDTGNLFTIDLVDTLTGMVQSTQTTYRPLYLDDAAWDGTASEAKRLKCLGSLEAPADLNTALGGGGLMRNYGSASYWSNGPASMSYGIVIELANNYSYNSLTTQLAFDVNHNVQGSTKDFWFRTSNNLGMPAADWAKVWHSKNANLSTVDWNAQSIKLGYGYVISDNEIWALNNSNSAQKMCVGGLLVSGNYAESTKVPNQGIYSVGTIQTNSAFVLPYAGTSWIGGAMTDNSLRGSVKTSQSNFHPLIRLDAYSGGRIVYGGLDNNIGFYGYKASKITDQTNGYSWSTTWNVETGDFIHNAGQMVINNGYLAIVRGGEVIRIGNLNRSAGLVHMYTDSGNPVAFNCSIFSTNGDLGSANYQWHNIYNDNTLHGRSINLRRGTYEASGIQFYDASYNAWQIYMSPAGNTTSGWRGNITAPSGQLVTSWALRSFTESLAGYGWTWESGSTYSTIPVVVAELSQDGHFRANGSVEGSALVIPRSKPANMKAGKTYLWME